MSVIAGGWTVLELNGSRLQPIFSVWVGSTCFGVKLRDPRSLRSAADGAGDAQRTPEAGLPMPGKIVRVPGDGEIRVERGRVVVVVEAMRCRTNQVAEKGRRPEILVHRARTSTPGTCWRLWSEAYSLPKGESFTVWRRTAAGHRIWRCLSSDPLHYALYSSVIAEYVDPLVILVSVIHPVVHDLPCRELSSLKEPQVSI